MEVRGGEETDFWDGGQDERKVVPRRGLNRRSPKRDVGEAGDDHGRDADQYSRVKSHSESAHAISRVSRFLRKSKKARDSENAQIADLCVPSQNMDGA